MPLTIPATGPAGGTGTQVEGHTVSSVGVRGVWARQTLLTKLQRLLRLEKVTGERKIEVAAINPAISMKQVGNPTLKAIAESVTSQFKRVIAAI